MPASEMDRPGPQQGHSLMEVMVSIVILCLAIIPMVGMFDVGSSLATRSGNYDRARAFANETLERARKMPYGEVQNEFPTGSAVPGAGGSYASPELPVPPGASLPAGATYTVTKQYVTVSEDPSTAVVTETDGDAGIIRIGVVVTWEGHSYAIHGVSASDVG